MTKATWRRTSPVTPDQLKCDLCLEPANTVHWLPYADDEATQVLFACPSHDPGGYWLPVTEVLRNDGIIDRDTAKHIDGKGERGVAMSMFWERLDQMTIIE